MLSVSYYELTYVILEPFGIHVEWRTDVKNMGVVSDFQIRIARLRATTNDI